MQYLLVYYGGSSGQTEEEQKAIMDDWFAWFGGLGAAVKDGGLPFSGAIKSVATDGSTSDGPIGEPATGYSILSADSLDAATAMAQACPVLKSGGSISVYESVDMPAPPT
ncbi:MAG TPA: hypothetical protein VG329_00585 [Candidatus Dormibacteraeota bacterium]|jgi:hypothetical protein|nr:hypothetical protein [Candidatus Dormibacteraeota bacterium]